MVAWRERMHKYCIDAAMYCTRLLYFQSIQMASDIQLHKWSHRVLHTIELSL